MLGWETFKWLQVLGFVLLVYGTFVYVSHSLGGGNSISCPFDR